MEFLLGLWIEGMAAVKTGATVTLKNLFLIRKRCLVCLLDVVVAVIHVLTFQPASIKASIVSYSPSNSSVS